MPHPRTHSISINTTSHVVAPQRSVLHAVHSVDSDKIDYTTTHTGMPHPRAHFASVNIPSHAVAPQRCLKLNIKTLQTIATNKTELYNFIATHFHKLDTQKLKQMSQKVFELVQLYRKIKEELIYIRENLPSVIEELKYS